MINDNFLPKELTDILNSPEFDDEAGMLIESLIYNDDDLVITFSIRFDPNNDTPQQLWQISIVGVEDEKITRSWVQDMEILTEHVLLLEYNDIHTELYLNGTTNDPQSLFIDIFQSVTQLSSDNADVVKYIFSTERVNELSQQGYGLFARGPKTILKIYEKCLIKAGIKSNFIGDYKPTPYNNPLVLLKLGDSYCICLDLQFKRLK